MLADYSPVSVTKSRICTAIANSETIREILNYKGLDPLYTYNPDEPLTLLWNCIYPALKDPDTITSADPQILVGVDADTDMDDPRTVWLTITIIIVVNYADMKTNYQYVREDLLEDGILKDTKTDRLATEITKTLAKNRSKTWIGDLKLVSSREGALNNATHYARTLVYNVKEINDGNRGI